MGFPGNNRSLGRQKYHSGCIEDIGGAKHIVEDIFNKFGSP